MNKLLIVCGPTASGKTALALRLAKKYNGELVSADSRQIYRGMDIGTGKDVIGKSKVKSQKLKIRIKDIAYELMPYDMDGIPLWMVDVVAPDEGFSVALYQQLVAPVITDIENRGKLPIVVGGTGLYVTSLLSPIETSHIPPNTKLRNQLQLLNLVDLQERLKYSNPLVWNTMNQSDRHNPRRLVRKIEIAEYTSNKEIEIQSNKDNDENRKQVLIIGLKAPFPLLYKKIDDRVDKRVDQGILKEIGGLISKGYTWDLPSMNTFGYKEWKDYFLLSHTSLLIPHILQRWKWNEHGYARRQMTWFKKMKGIQWCDISQAGWQEKVETVVEEWYTKK